MNGNTSGRGLQSAPIVPPAVAVPGADLLVHLTPDLRRDPRMELRNLSLRGDHRMILDQRAKQEGLEFHDDSRADDYNPQQRRAFTVIRGPDVEVVVFQIADWIARDGGCIGALTEAVHAFRGKHICILSVGVDIPADGLDVLRWRWKRDLQIEAEFVPWHYVSEMKGTLGSVFGVPPRKALTNGFQVFISYSHKDCRWLERLLDMLKPVERRFPTAVWSDAKIEAGVRWAPEIEQALASAKVVMLLVSPYFLASDFVNQNELGPVLTAAKKGQKEIIWVLLSDCLWMQTEIKDYQAAHDIKKPLDALTRSKQNAQLRIVAETVLKKLGSRE
jgi:hypothetical protein